MNYSVIIPSYNYGRYLPESIESALNQTVPPHEVLIVDDGSTDDTPKIMERYLSDSRVKYLRQKNRGVSSARNLGILHSTTELIALLDADDKWRLDKMALQLPLFKKNETDVVYSLKQPFNESGVIHDFKHVDVFRGDILPHLMQHNIICTSSAVIRKSCLASAGLFNTSLTQGEDFDLWLRIAGEGNEFDFVEEPLVLYRVGGNASAMSSMNKRFADNRRTLANFFSNPLYQTRISPTMRRTAWAATWRKEGYFLLDHGKRLQALCRCLLSLVYMPSDRMTWRTLIRGLLPRSFVSMIRSLQKTE